jgi:hypothetical protein
LRGEIGTFSVAEILQLIGMQEKTGVLRVRSRGRSAVLFFHGGKVVSARDRRQGAKDPFLVYLQENEAIGVEGFNRVLEAKQNEGGDIVDILLGEKMVDEQVLGRLMTQYTTSTLENLVKWESGTYEFTPSTDGMPERSVTQPLRLEPILMEALRRKDEVEEIRRFLPSFDTPIRVAGPDAEELPLEEQDSAVLSLVNGRTTIEEIVEQSEIDEVETLDILERLFALGIVSIAESTETPRMRASRSPLRSAALTAAIVAAAILIRWLWLAPESPRELPVGRARLAVERFTEAREIQNLHFALDAYRELLGRYPDQLGDLVKSGILVDHQIRDSYGKIYPYRALHSEERYLLPGTD